MEDQDVEKSREEGFAVLALKRCSDGGGVFLCVSVCVWTMKEYIVVTRS